MSAGAAWLADYTPNPQATLARWARGDLERVPSGCDWLVVEAPLLRSAAVMGHLSRAGKLGPVMGYAEADRAWWLVPTDAQDHLGDLHRQLTLLPAGWELPCPSPDHYAHGRGWLEKPDGAGTLNCPATLGASFVRSNSLPAKAFG